MPNQVNVNQYSITIEDYSREQSSTQFAIQSLTDAAAYTSAETAFRVSYGEISSGNIQQNRASLVEFRGSGPSTNTESRRERKMLCRIRDNVTNRTYIFTVPSPNMAIITLQPNTDLVDLTTDEMSDFVVAVNAFVASPLGNPVTLYEAEIRGRNL